MVKKKPGGATIPSAPLRILMLEDNPNDAKLAARVLERSGIAIKHEITDTKEAYREHLAKGEFDVILADYNLRGWTAIDALDILKQSGRDIPFVVMTGTLGDEDAAECIKRGATDFILKDRPARLPAAIQRACAEKRLSGEKRRADAALNEETNLLFTLMDRLPDVIYFKDRESRFTRINVALATLFGLSDPSEAVGKSDRDFFTQEHAQAAYADEQSIIQTGEPIVGKEEMETWPDGHISWVSTTKMPMRDTHGNIVGTFGASRDITERKLAEAALRESESRYRTLFERNLAGVFCTTWDGRIVDCNQAMADIMGFASPQAGISASVLDLWVSLEDRANFLKDLAATGRLNNYEMHLRRQDGREVWLIGNISLAPPTATGLQLIEGTLIDITKRKRTDAENGHLAQIVNSSENAIFSTTREGLIATWNAGAERMFGYALDEIAGTHYSMLVPDEHRAELAGNRTTLFRGEAFLHYENEAVRKDGSIFPVLLTLSPIKDRKGAVTGVSVIGRDITERKRAEEALRAGEEKGCKCELAERPKPYQITI